MERYSIGDLERTSGVKAHTIRIWEQRYGLLSPMRSNGGTRYYCEDDMMRLMLVSLLVKSGMRISTLAKYSLPQLHDLVEIDHQSEKTFEEIMEQLMIESLEFNQTSLMVVMNQTIETYGIEIAFTHVVFPFLRRVGMLWLTGKITPGHEHFFSNLCRQKLFSEIDRLPDCNKQLPHVVLLQPLWDFHELGILFYYYLIKKSVYPSTYLGQAVPVKDAIETIAKTKASIVISSFIAPTTEEIIKEYILPIIQQSPNTHFYLTGPHLIFDFQQYSKQITIFRSIDELKQSLQLNNSIQE